MKRSFLFLMLLTLIVGSSAVYAQEPVYTWGEPGTNNNPEREIDKLITLDDLGFVILRKAVAATTVATYWIEFYGPDLNYQGTYPLNFNGGVMGDAYFIEDIQVADGAIWAFVTHWNKAGGVHELLVSELSFEGELSEYKVLSTVKAEKMRNRGRFEFDFSDDGNILAVLTEEAWVKKVNGKMSVSTFSTGDFKELNSSSTDLKWSSKESRDLQIAVNNEGKTICYASYSVKPNLAYTLLTCDDAGKWKMEPINVEAEAQILDFKLFFDADNYGNAVGLYTNVPSNFDKKVHGRIFMHFNSDLSVGTNSIGPFDAQLVAQYKSDKVANDPSKSHIDDIYLKDVLIRDDGNILMLIEQLREKSEVIPGTSPMQFTYEWQYRDAIVLCLERGTGKLNWSQSFRKSQDLKSNLSQDLYGSYIYHLKEDRLYMIWNNTALSVPSIPPAFWKEADGSKYVKNKVFDEKTVHGSFMRVIEPDGSMAYQNRTHGLPLLRLHEGAIFEMSVTTPFYFTLNGDLVVMAAMHNGGKRYRFGFIGL